MTDWGSAHPLDPPPREGVPSPSPSAHPLNPPPVEGVVVRSPALMEGVVVRSPPPMEGGSYCDRDLYVEGMELVVFEMETLHRESVKI